MKTTYQIRVSSWQSMLYRLASVGAVAVLICFLLLITFNGLFAKPEASLAQLLLAASTLLGALALTQIFYTGFKRLVDPPLFLSVLIFAFISLSSFLLSSANISNTFGPIGIKYTGGILIMALAGLYYLIVLFTNSAARLSWLQGSLVVSFSLLAMAEWWQLRDGVITIPVVSYLLLWPLLVSWLYSKSPTMRVLSAIGTIFALWALLQPVKLNLPFVVSMLVGLWLVLSLIYSSPQIKQGVTGYLRSIPANWRLYKDGGQDLPALLMHLAPLLISIIWFSLLAIAVVWLANGNQEVSAEFSAQANRLQVVLQGLASSGQLLIGKGAIVATARYSLVTNVLYMQGLVGLLGYLFIWGAAIMLAISRLFREQRLPDLPKVGTVFTPFLLVVPVLSLIAAPQFAIILLWWIALGILAAAELLRVTKPVTFSLLQRWNLRYLMLEGWLPKIRLLLVIVLLIAWIYLVTHLPV